jgi:hypothetical protein
MSSQQGRPDQNKAIMAGISGAILGGISGALIGASFSGVDGALIGALAGALYMGITEAITDIRRRSGELKPLWHRLIGSAIVGAALGALLGLIFDSPIVVGFAIGLVSGLVNLSPRKILLGVAVGLSVGAIAQTMNPEFNPSIVGGSVVLIYRLLLLVFFKDTAPLQLAGEHVPPEDAKYVAPYEAHTKHIGAEFMQTLARESDGTFKRNKPGIGIVETMNALRGPTFDPDRVDPLIREFYEHTSRFRLSIEPQWNPFIRPFFWFFKTFIATKIGQANLPFNTDEAHRGMVSYIDSIDYEDEAEEADHIKTLRGWIRAYEDSGEAIYVGVYTVVRYMGAGFVSVGFPLPEANFTATLLPFNNRGSDFILKTHGTGTRFTGHYLADIDSQDGTLTILKLPTMGEEIDVYVREGELKTDHRFYFGNYRFLTLYYTIERKADDDGGEQ